MAQIADEVRRGRAEPRTLPHSLEAEESVLGAMMLSAEAIADVIEILKPDEFYRRANSTIYEGLLAMYARGEPVDAITAVEELKRHGQLQGVGGALRIQELVERVPSPASASYYAKIVADHALLRRLISAAADVMELAYAVPEHPRVAAEQAEGKIYAASRHEQRDEMVALQPVISAAIDDIEHIQSRESSLAGLPTGFRDVDELLSGLQAGNFIIIAARPGAGKSALAVNIARNVAVAERQPVALFSLEMSRWELGMRLLCSEAGVPMAKVRAGKIGAADFSAFADAADTLHDAPMWIMDAGDVTILDIRAKARRMRSRDGLALIVVDYLQLMSPHRRVDNRQQEIAEISRSLKLLAKELHIPVVALSQLNRDPERREGAKPQLSNLRECVTGDTTVALADGRQVPIRDLVGTTPEVVAIGSDGRLCTARSDLVWSVGARPVFEVKLASGRRIRATARHLLYGFDRWIRVEDLKPGARLGIPRHLPEPAVTEAWPDDRVVLLGHLVGDGSYLTHQPLRYTTASEENSYAVTMAATKQFGVRVKRYAGRGNWHQLVISGNGNRWHPAGVNRWLRELGVFGQRSHEKCLPEAAFRLPNRQVALLLRHLWSTDGSITIRRSGQRGSPGVHFSTASRGLADDVAVLLSRLGIVARIRVARQREARWYSVAISGGGNLLRFLDEVGGFGPRHAPAETLATALQGHRSNTNVDTLPREVFDRVQAVMAARGISRGMMTAMRGTPYGSAIFSFSPSRDVVAGYASLLNDDVLRVHATSDIYWDRVLSVDPAGEEEVFDLTVPGPSSLIANGIFSHNSGALEQDADVVMFIHREKDEDGHWVKGEAELIVAKHRNGPTGTIKLAFRDDLIRFNNLYRG